MLIYHIEVRAYDELMITLVMMIRPKEILFWESIINLTSGQVEVSSKTLVLPFNVLSNT